MKIKFILIFLLIIGVYYSAPEVYAQNSSTRKERNNINAGNKLYEKGDYLGAIKKYQDALKENPSSNVARFNLGLSQINIGSNPADTSATAKNMLNQGMNYLEQIAKTGNQNPSLAAAANYNLGNVAFNSEDYTKALGYYKQALRLNPDDDKARRNLRITQLKLQNQDDNKDDNKQDQNQDQQKDDQQDQKDNNNDNKQNNDNKEDQQNPPPQSDINPQTAEQIMNAIENKENQTRARVTGQQGDKAAARNSSLKNW